jgi:hypothetical protein
MYLISLIALIITTLTATLGCAPRLTTGPVAVTPAQTSATFANLPMSFVANDGQSDAQVQFTARGAGYNLFLTDTEAVLSLRAASGATSLANPMSVVRMRLVGANPRPSLAGLDRLPGTHNYFIGDASEWQRNVPTYAKVHYTSVYPGIDLVYYGNQRQLEYDFVVAPGSDPDRIAIAFDGVQQLSIDSTGNLVLQTPHGNITQLAPVVYQNIGGTRQRVDGHYVLRGEQRVGFEIATYDTTQPLVIDPILTYATYLGGNSNDIGHAIAIDSAGNAYVTGETQSLNFPGASGSPIQPTKQASYDVFVSKLNAAGTALVYSTYLGGSGGDYGYAIALDSAGNAYVTGQTDSPTTAGVGNVAFPRVGAFQPLYRGGGDAFVTKINPAGDALVFSTYLGGSGVERGYGIAVDGFGSVFVTGHTNSVTAGGGGFPTANAIQPENSGSYDAFVSKFNPAASGLVFSTYLGGPGSEYSLYGGAIAVTADGNAVVGGSADAGFPIVNAVQGAYGGGVSDGFITYFTPTGTALYSTFLGGTAYDAVHGLAIGPTGDVFVAGYTDSTNFPVAGPIHCVTIYLCSRLILQPTKGTGEDGFVARLNAAGTALIYSTYFGGNGGDRAYDVAVDVTSQAYVVGWTTSTNLPTSAPFQPTHRGSGDAFIGVLHETGTPLRHGSYLGGATGSELAYGIAVAPNTGDAYVTGSTNSTDFPVVGALQPILGVPGTDAFLAKITVAGDPPGPPTNFTVASVVGNSVTVTWSAPASLPRASGYVLEGGVAPGEVLASLPTNSTATSYTFTAPTGAFYIRLHSLAGVARSVASNEVRLFVNVPAPPSAPTNLLALVNGSSLTLAWMNTAAGGPPTAIIADVTGSLNLSLGLPVSESFSIANVPAGTYTVSLRASNDQGPSGSSNSVTFTVPGACSGMPAVPSNLVVTRNGSLITASWQLPVSGPAPTSYLLNVSGAFTGQLATTGRTISGAVGSGTYTLNVSAVNACGTGPATPSQTITVP